ncbi:MAG: DegQ family serine endoprotease [Chromatiales bacterium]|nr:DegQ family serine endoprotease [Chromatiales bacterium]
MKRTVLFLALILNPLYALAALPASVDGQVLPSLAPMLERVMPAVVNISSRAAGKASADDGMDSRLRRFFDLPAPKGDQPRVRNLGSGVIVDARNGYIVTNHHVIEDADEITVTLKDQRKLRAKLVGADPDTDVAVIRVEAQGLSEVPMADSDRHRVGDFVVAIGNPFGLGQTATSGIISATGRSGLGIEGYEDFIQTDASINPGNSGGALVNLNGELIGINTAILAPGGGNIGIGFAIPINMVRSIQTQLVEYGEMRRGRLGVQIQDLSPQLAEAFGLDYGKGAVITKVFPGTPAQAAGLEPGQIIVAVNGRDVDNAADLRNLIGLIRAGGSVELDLIHQTKHKHLRLVVEEPRVSAVDGGQFHPRFEGAELAAIEPGHPRYGETQGIEVISVQTPSRAANAGLRPGDVIEGINRTEVHDLSDLARATRNQRQLLIQLRRSDEVLGLLLQ